MSRREEAVDSAVTVQVLMTTTSGVSPAWARSKPRAPRASRACSLSAWLSRQPRVLKATLGAAGAAAAPAAGSAIGERLHQRALRGVAGLPGRMDADELGAGEHRPPAVAVAEQQVGGVGGLGVVLAQRPVGLLGHGGGVDHAGELLVGGAA